MLDIKFIRENPDLINKAAQKKHLDFDVRKLLKVDGKRRELMQKTEEIRAKQKRTEDREEASKLKTDFKKLETELVETENEWKQLMLEVPNIPDPSVPQGKSDADNVEVRRWGKLPEFNFPIKNHVELMENLKLVDFERGAKVSGFRGYFLKGEAALLCLAIVQYTFEQFLKNGFTPFLAPALARESAFLGTGWLPQGKEEVYKTQDDLYLAGTAEVPMMALHADEILKEEDLPKTYVAFSPCFRREAGSYGKDAKGIFRLHEFMKVEQIILCWADHEESVKWHEEITRNSEKIMQSLKIPYRVVVNCGGDLGLGQIKKYDIEAWVPSENRFRETHSSSYFHDFQTRRLNIRYKNKNGEIKFAHSLNNTAIATPRILISLLENNQENDGSVRIPEVLQKYVCGAKKIS